MKDAARYVLIVVTIAIMMAAPALSMAAATKALVTLTLTHPAGKSPKVFTKGWVFGANCEVNGKDMSKQIRWSGSGTFSPKTGSRSRPTFSKPGVNTIVLTIELGKKQKVSRAFKVNAVSPDNYASVGSPVFCPNDSHKCPKCPHSVSGSIETGSSNVIVRGKPAARVGDTGKHSSCCGTNTFKIVGGDAYVLINGKPAARFGDTTEHCGGMGKITAKPAEAEPEEDTAGKTRMPGGEWLDLSKLPWQIEATWPNGQTRRRAARIEKYQFYEYYLDDGTLSGRDIEPIKAGEGRTVYGYKYHTNGQLKESSHIAVGLGNIGPRLEFFDDGEQKRVAKYHPAKLDKNGAYVRTNNEAFSDIEWFRTGGVMLEITRDIKGNGTGKRNLPDGRLWYTDHYENNVIVEHEEHLTAEELKGVPIW